MKQRELTGKTISRLLAVLVCMFMISFSLAHAQTPSEQTRPAEPGAASQQPGDAEALLPQPMADQESSAAFAEANATATLAAHSAPAQSELALEGGNQTEATPDKPSYGSFLEHKQEPKSTNIMDTGNSLIASAFSMAAYLCLILGVIFLGFWLLRKFGPRGIAKAGETMNPQLVGRLMLGQKKQVDVIRVQGRTLLLGVTDERINLLAELETQPGQCFEEEDEDEFTNFTEMLGKQMDSDSSD